MSIEITHVPGSADRVFECTIATPHIEGLESGEKVTWELGATSANMVATFMAAFTSVTASNKARRAALVGAGRKLFRATPKRFQEAYWELQELERPLSISVVSDEPYLPWELMVPNRSGTQLPALAVAHSVGRWVHPGHRSGDQVRRLHDSVVIAPRYGPDKFLPFSDAEAEYVRKRFPGQRIDPATFDAIEGKIGAGASLVHVVCHGSTPGDGTQIIDLDPDETLNDFALEGMEALSAAISAQRPFVFINACEIGRQTPALVGTGGFAAAFIMLGAACVIAPIWSVKDEVASQMARTFYEQVGAQPGTPFAQIMRDLRRNAYVGKNPEDGCAAYCFFGDPLAASFA